MSVYPTSPQPIKVQTASITYKTLVSESEDGYEQRRMVWPRGKRKFELQYDVLTQTEMQTLWDFYVTCSGMYNSFTFFDHVSNANYTCRFTEDTLSFREFQYKVYQGNLVLTEIF